MGTCGDVKMHRSRSRCVRGGDDSECARSSPASSETTSFDPLERLAEARSRKGDFLTKQIADSVGVFHRAMATSIVPFEWLEGAPNCSRLGSAMVESSTHVNIATDERKCLEGARLMVMPR